MEFSVMMGILGDGYMLTAQIFVVTLVGSLPLGVVVALARMSRFKPLAWVAQLYISILRGTPLMLQLMAIMFGPYYLLGLNMGSDWKFGACAIGFILNYAAYFAEIYRSGIQSIPRGQYEAARSQGLSGAQMYVHIILPQALRNMVPALLSQFVTTIKDTSYLWGAMALQELMGRGMILMNSYNSTTQIFAIFALMALLYFIVCFTLSQIVRAYQRKIKQARTA